MNRFFLLYILYLIVIVEEVLADTNRPYNQAVTPLVLAEKNFSCLTSPNFNQCGNTDYCSPDDMSECYRTQVLCKKKDPKLPYLCGRKSDLCVKNYIECGCENGFLCPLGGCATSPDKCLPIPSCRDLDARRCPDGSCVTFNAECPAKSATLSICSEGYSKSIDGVCRPFEIAYNLPFFGCLSLEVRCPDGSCNNINYTKCPPCPSESPKFLCNYVGSICTTTSFKCKTTTAEGDIKTLMMVSTVSAPGSSRTIVEAPAVANVSTLNGGLSSSGQKRYTSSIYTPVGIFTAFSDSFLPSTENPYVDPLYVNPKNMEPNTVILRVSGGATNNLAPSLLKYKLSPLISVTSPGQTILQKNGTMQIQIPQYFLSTANINPNFACLAIVDPISNTLNCLFNNSITMDNDSVIYTAPTNSLGDFAVIAPSNCQISTDQAANDFCRFHAAGYYCTDYGTKVFHCVDFTGAFRVGNETGCSAGTYCNCCSSTNCVGVSSGCVPFSTAFLP